MGRYFLVTDEVSGAVLARDAGAEQPYPVSFEIQLIQVKVLSCYAFKLRVAWRGD